MSISASSARCPLCKSMVAANEDACLTCGFPVRGSSIEKEDFKRRRYEKHEALNKVKNRVMMAQSVLVLVTFTTLIAAGYTIYRYTQLTPEQGSFIQPIVMINCAVFAGYLGLTILSFYKPLPAMVAGTVLYLVLLFMNGIPNSSFMSLLWTGLIIIGFILGIYSVYKAENLKRKLDN